MLDIQVEVGTEKQKVLIKAELELIFSIASTLDPPISIYKIVVPVSFDDAVRELEGRTTYKSSREVGGSLVTAQAKVIGEQDSFCLVISPNLFTEFQDNQTRLLTYTHELSHLLNRKRFVKQDLLSGSGKIYFDHLYIFVDEYFADRKAFGMVQELFPQRSELLQQSIRSQVEGYAYLLNDPSHMHELRRLSRELYHHRNIVTFLAEIQPIFDALFVNTAHAFALDHSLQEHDVYSQIESSPFINEDTLSLINYSREKYLRKEYEFEDGIDLVRLAIKNFGIEFEDRGGELICHVD